MDSDKETKLQKEVTSLFELLADFKKEVNWQSYSSEEGAEDRRTRNILLAIIVFVILVFAITKLFPAALVSLFGNPRAAIQVILLIFLLLGAVMIWRTVGVFKTIFQDQTENLLRGIGQVAKDEVGLFNQLDNYSTESISYVAERLELSSNQAQTATGLFIGALEKVGLIPGIIATSFALDKALNSAEFSGLEFLSIGVALLYLLMMRLALAANRFQQYRFVLVQYLEPKRADSKSKT